MNSNSIISTILLWNTQSNKAKILRKFKTNHSHTTPRYFCLHFFPARPPYQTVIIGHLPSENSERYFSKTFAGYAKIKLLIIIFLEKKCMPKENSENSHEALNKTNFQ